MVEDKETWVLHNTPNIGTLLTTTALFSSSTRLAGSSMPGRKSRHSTWSKMMARMPCPPGSHKDAEQEVQVGRWGPQFEVLGVFGPRTNG